MKNAAIVLLLLSVAVTVADGPAMLATNPPIYYEPADNRYSATVNDSDILTFVPPDNASQIVSITPHDDDVEINIPSTATCTMTIANDGSVRIVIDKAK